MAEVHAPDGAVGGFVAACDRALDLGRALEQQYEMNGDRRASQVRRAINIIEAIRAQALDGSLPRPTPDGPLLGLSRGISEFDFRSEGREFVDSVYDIEKYWSREMAG